VNKDIVVRLKWGETEYKGRLVSIDSYMNIQLTNAQEFIDQKFTSDLGQILIRCVALISTSMPSNNEVIR
jgi:small nuclear ribonucleoprotein F